MLLGASSYTMADSFFLDETDYPEKTTILASRSSYQTNDILKVSWHLAAIFLQKTDDIIIISHWQNGQDYSQGNSWLYTTAVEKFENIPE